jgi:hypothetical protein
MLEKLFVMAIQADEAVKLYNNTHRLSGHDS